MTQKSTEIGLLIARLVLGITFLVHGIIKFQSGLGNIAGWFESIGLPGYVAYVTAVIEVVGGIAMIIGLGTRIVGTLFTIIMLGAIFTAKLPGGFTGTPQMPGYELDLALLAISVLLILSGSRMIAVDRYFSRSQQA